jgi:hypothetical protein
VVDLAAAARAVVSVAAVEVLTAVALGGHGDRPVDRCFFDGDHGVSLVGASFTERNEATWGYMTRNCPK